MECSKFLLFSLIAPSSPFSSKIREEDYRQIQTNVPFLAPEILAVFQNSQIFHDHQPSKSLAIVHKSSSHSDDARRQSLTNTDAETTLIKRLEGNAIKTKSKRTLKHKWLTNLRFTIPIVWSEKLTKENSLYFLCVRWVVFTVVWNWFW